MDVRHLRYFLEIVERGSITGAAQSLNVAQPALSLHVKNMEEQLGTRLLLRSRSGTVPTQAGALLARRARTILDDLARTEDDIRTLDRDPSGLVRIGLPGTIGGIIALPLLEAVRDAYPGIRLNIVEGMSGFISGWLSEGRVDLAVLYNQPTAADAVSEMLLEEELVVLWRGDLERLPEMSLSGLRGVPLVLPSAEHGLRIQIEAVLRELGFAPNVVVEIDSYANIKRLVASGFGASILPLHTVREEVRAGHLAVSRIAAPGLWRSVHLVQPAAGPATRAQEAVCTLVHDTVLGLVASGEWTGARSPQTA